jgi:methylated-DNA-[protein]-cysteine S-methyltransferase
MHAALLHSPVGPLYVALDGGFLTHLDTNGHGAPQGDDDPRFTQIKRQLEEYFAGSRTQFDAPLALRGDAFQARVWAELQRIPYGETVSYGHVAKRIGAPDAARAVGLANGQNPIAVIVPCHRVIGADGSLTGYGGGLERKRLLLELESGVLSL